MSIRVIGQVMQRYPAGGGEYTLALALAWHAADDGTRIFPSVKKLAEESRQSVRTVQYQLRRMQEAGWLQLVGNAHGGTGRTREYRINAAWLSGEPPAQDCGEPAATPHEDDPGDARHQATESKLQTFDQWIDACKAAGRRPIPEGSPVFDYCDRIGINGDFLSLHWREFVDRHRGRDKRQRDWPERFFLSVKNNAYRLWVVRRNGEFELTTVGRQAYFASESK